MVIDYLIGLGMSEDDAAKTFFTYPVYEVTDEYLLLNIPIIYNYLLDFGYSKEEIIKLFKKNPQLLFYPVNTLEQKLKNLLSLGFNSSNIIKMCKLFSSILSYSSDTIKNKMDFLSEFGYSEEERIHIIENLPSLIGLSKETIRNKINFYRSINLDFWIPLKPKFLMQSIKLSYARYMHLLSKGIVIDENSYLKLFMNKKQFTSQFSITKKELLSMYPYFELKSVRS